MRRTLRLNKKRKKKTKAPTANSRLFWDFIFKISRKKQQQQKNIYIFAKFFANEKRVKDSVWFQKNNNYFEKSKSVCVRMWEGVWKSEIIITDSIDLIFIKVKFSFFVPKYYLQFGFLSPESRGVESTKWPVQRERWKFSLYFGIWSIW